MANISNFSTTELYTTSVFNVSQIFYTSFTSTSIDELNTIHPTTSSRAGSILLFLLILILISIWIYWCITFWNHREMRAYKQHLGIRNPKFILLAYGVMAILLFERGIAMIYLCWKHELQMNPQNEAIIYSQSADLTLHFIFWFGFWLFLQLKYLKFWMMLYHYSYSLEKVNFGWTEHLGILSVEPTSFWMRYRDIVGNKNMMLLLQFVAVIIVICIQILIRLLLLKYEGAVIVEQAIIIIIISGEFIFFVWMIQQIQSCNDNYFIKQQCLREIILIAMGIFCWMLGLIIYAETNEYELILSAITLYVIWISIFCYFETIWLLKRIDNDWVNRRMHDYYNSNPSHIGFVAQRIKLSDILRDQQGFEAMMRFLVDSNEYNDACQNLLCYIEMTQFISTWSPVGINRRKCRLLVIGHLKDCNDSYSIYIPHDITDLVSKYYLKLYAEEYEEMMTDHINKYRGSINIEMQPFGIANNRERDKNVMVEDFSYFQERDFNDDVSHFDYLAKKYIYDSASLQINICMALRSEAQYMTPGADAEIYVKLVYDIRVELWSLIRDSFQRFRKTEEFEKIAQYLANKRK